MKQLILVAVFCFSSLSALLAKPGPGGNIVSSSLKSAIVYRSGAELYHTAKVTLSQGNNEFIIDGISNRIELNSVRVASDAALTIMAIEFGTNYLVEENRSPELKKLDDSLIAVNKDFSLVQSNIKTNKELQSVLASNKTIAGAQNGVNVQELMKMMDYYRSKSLELQKELLQLQEKEDKLLKLIRKLGEQISEAEQKNVKTTGQLSIRAFSPAAGAVNLTISYITPLASWNPTYDLRVDNINKPVNIGFKAKLTQTSGIDWKNVKLTLATSMPNLNATAPELQSWLLAFPAIAQARQNSLQYALQGKVAGVAVAAAPLQEVVVTRIRGNSSIASDEAVEPIYVVDGNVMETDDYKKINPKAIKSVSILKDKSAMSLYGTRAAGGAIVVTLKKGLEDYVAVSDNELNVTYEIELPYDVPTNGKEQVVGLKDRVAEASYKYFSAPVRDKDAYLLGCIADWGNLQLLPGEANIIFEGTYVGKTFIDPGTTKDTLNLTLGKDRRVVVTREKLKDFSSVKFLGNNKKQILTYEITVKNNKKEEVQLQLKDLYPIPTDKEIEVELLEASNASVDKEAAFLTWNLQLKPGESRKLRLSYSVKYPKDKQLPL
ncbi:mucoidy inhibitor MuiA family protein [Pseudoflavitalea sp. G-6-1-2]|uniref:DUF4139 domain-containing protein n=1 Tax=Pseudoflavitalea sp. G-6-1-2 TaxID=2728841 RepID=UPI00146ECE48|nr:DUF4139 domain-containing protein [Pseudoflavitalea sp. G-6-1-2]NML21041.1 mucoidy inhibitor MuiA family protein [Pseudoflavitalea sp. G-6-1-2]